MSGIDWSKAPEWAGAVVESERGVRFWVSQFGGTSARQRVGSLYPEEDSRADMTADDHGWLLIENRPSPAWNGEGLPPVGVRCEAGIPHASGPNNERSFIWIEGSVIAYHEIKGKTYAWFSEDDGFYPPNVLEFRPIRTPEQIAADEREEAVAAMLELDPYQPNTTLGMMSRADFCRTLHDAGYRKQADK